MEAPLARRFSSWKHASNADCCQKLYIFFLLDPQAGRLGLGQLSPLCLSTPEPFLGALETLSPSLPPALTCLLLSAERWHCLLFFCHKRLRDLIDRQSPKDKVKTGKKRVPAVQGQGKTKTSEYVADHVVLVEGIRLGERKHCLQLT